MNHQPTTTMNTPNFRAELQALVDAHRQHMGMWGQYHEDALDDAMARARAALDEPMPDRDEQMAAVVAAMAELAFDVSPYAADFETRAADLLSRLAPQPVPEGPTDAELLRCAISATPCYDTKAWDRELQMMRAAIALDRARWGRA